MKQLLIASLIMLSTNAFTATPTNSELKFRGCLSLVYSTAANSKSDAKSTIQSVSSGVKACRKTVSALKKNETKMKRITKLKEQLAKLEK